MMPHDVMELSYNTSLKYHNQCQGFAMWVYFQSRRIKQAIRSRIQKETFGEKETLPKETLPINPDVDDGLEERAYTSCRRYEFRDHHPRFQW